MPLVSVIIPIYNTEKFLPLCISSVLNQTLTDIEVLLVNDGSTDGSGKICDEYACKDQRIQVIHTLSQGVSHARNQGLETAKGEYIAFMDSDDWIETDMIATLYQLIRTNEAGCVPCGRWNCSSLRWRHPIGLCLYSYFWLCGVSVWLLYPVKLPYSVLEDNRVRSDYRHPV